MLKSEQSSATKDTHLKKNSQSQHADWKLAVDPTQRHQLLMTWNDTTVIYPEYDLLHQLVEKQVARTPDAIAVRYENAQITYKELNQRANLLARRLNTVGIGPDVLVGVCMERSVELVIALLAVLKAGGAYVPLDPSYPQDRLTYMIADAHVPLVLTQKAVEARISLHGVSTIALDATEIGPITQTEAENLDKPIHAENLAYMIYTSGSTGKPKGAMNRHRSIHNRLVWMQDTYQLTEQDRVLQKTPFSFDVSVWEFFWPLSSGASLVMARPDGHKDPAYLKAILIEQAITTLHFVPAMLQTFLLESDLLQVSSVRQVMCSGEALSVELQAQFFDHFSEHVDLHNLYGPTEAAIDVTSWTCQRTDKEQRSVPIGRPIANTQLYILDTSLEPTAIGVAGELYIGGVNLARGYYRRPDLTAERFVPNPFSQEAGTLLYKTGDLACYRADGAIEYVRRIDHQVKLRGFRIELGEIEAALQQQSGILQAITIVREDNPGDKRLVAYLLTQENAPTSETLRAAIKAKLPDYMVPATFVFLDVFPLSPSGKVDRQALPVPDHALNRQDHPLVAPRNPVEEMLVNIWMTVLHLQQISVLDNFFELGGHSLLVAQVIARLRQSLQIEVPNRSLFEMPTIATLAQHIETLRQLPSHASAATEPALTPMVRPAAIPASFSQQSLWFLQQLDPTSVAYNLPSAYQLEGPLVISILEQSLNALVHRHETLRTTFADQDGQALQVIMPEYSLPLPVIDIRDRIRDRHAATPEKLIQQLTRQQSQMPFDLATGPLLRVWLLRVAEQSHVLLLTMHHIISDGWSTDVLLRDLTSLYQAHIQGTAPALPALPIQYADYTLWQKQWLQGQLLHDHLSYWQQHLAGAPSLSTLPSDRPRPTIQTGEGAQLMVLLPTQFHLALKTLSQQEGVTLFMTLLAAFQIVLLRSSGQTDFVIGTPVANRSHTEVEDLLGYFVNTLALHADLADNPSFRQLLTRVRAMTLQAYEHQDIAFEQVVQSLQIERSLSYTPLFQIMFSMQRPAQSAPQAGGLSWDAVDVDSTSSKFDLTFDAQEQADGLRIKIEYNTDLYNASTIERLLTHWQVLLQSILADPTQPIAALPMLADAERHQLLETWNETAVAYPAYATLCQLFEAQVIRRPHATAVSSIDGTLSYQELNAKANQLARTLRKQGVEAETLVGICMDRSTEMLVALLSILKAGGAYVPIDPMYPADRIAYMLEDSQVQCLLTQHHLLPLLAATTATIICLDREWDQIAQEATENVTSTVTADNLAYILYTSGSTGRPKGVQIPHRSLINFELAMHDLLTLTENDTLMAITTLSFDIAGLELYLPLICGAQVSIETREVAADGHQLLQRLQEVRPTLLQATPATWRMLLAAGAANFSSLTILCGGEALPVELRDQLLACKPVAFWNVYGPTETTIWSLASEITSRDAAITIGRPIANTQIYILDANQQPLPIGVPGELYIGGAGLARGYLHQSALTQENFIPHPFCVQTTERLYRTGDLARYLENGEIDFLGRIDHQVKIRGFRIELGEIEMVLQQVAEVKQVVVIDREDTPGDKRLVAYIIAGEHPPTIQSLRTALKEKLPMYMVPAAFVFLTALPLTPNGKINRKALPAPTNLDLVQDHPLVAPRTSTEEMLAHIWANVLHLQQISVHDNFFELGGHSLLVAQVIARLRQSLQIEVPNRSLFEMPTIATLAQHIETLRQLPSHASAATEPALTPMVRPAAIPASFSQQSLWFLQQLDPTSVAYNLPSAYQLEGPLVISILEQSLNALVHRHETLRTTFADQDGQALQVIMPEYSLPLPVIDIRDRIRDRHAATPEKLIQQLTRQQSQMPFDLATGPLLRVWLLRVAEQSHVLLLTMHHIISDGWSTDVLLRDLTSLYQAHIQGTAPALPALPIQYADYTLWQKQWLQGQLLHDHLSYWQQHLAGAPSLSTLPSDRPRPTIQTGEGAQLMVLLPTQFHLALKTLSQQEGVTLFMTLLAAFQIVLLRSSGQTDFVIGTPVANRSHTEVEDLLGYFVNTLALHTDLADNPSFRQLLTRVRDMTLQAYAHQDIAFEQVVQSLQIERSLSYTPLFQVMFSMQRPAQSAPQAGGLSWDAMDVDSTSSKFDLTFDAQEQADGLRIKIEYNTDLYNASTIERLLTHWQVLLQSILADPTQPIAALPMLADAERHQLLETWNETAVAYPADTTLCQLFEAQVIRRPHATAVSSIDGTLSYQELNAKANQLARMLRKRGVQAETLVGICMDRSTEMLVALLSILKAGGAYVPIDPMYPADRIAYMLEDSQVQCLLTQHHHLPLLAATTATIICLDHEQDQIAQEATENVTATVTADNLAYILYTSGSTGRPKGVQIPHRSLINFELAAHDLLTLTENDTLMAITTLSFDLAGLELYLPLICGAQVSIETREVAADGHQLLQRLQEVRPTLLQATPATWRMLLAAGAADFSSLTILCGGEALPVELRDQLLACKPVAFWNIYGPTETTIWSLASEITSHDAAITIGRPIANTQIYILDANQQPLPIGVPGELYIGGAGLARGYLHQPALTQEKFIPHPFRVQTTERLYRTGDLARYLENGEIDFLGRIDHQVKIRGFRIELGEIETVLQQVAEVKQAVVIDREDTPGDKRLVAYMIAGEHPPTIQSLRTTLKEKLPMYMVPTAFVFLTALPLTPNGKIDRKALPAPTSLDLVQDMTLVAPRTSTEEMLAHIWATVLHLQQISVHDNFFELGGHSLLVAQVISRLRQSLQIEVPNRSLFEMPTIATLAQHIETLQQLPSHASAATERDLTSIVRPTTIPASFSQQSLWFLQQLDPTSVAYNIQTAYRLKGPLVISVLEQSLNALVCRHETLRTTFAGQDGQALQVIMPEYSLPLPVIDIRDMRIAAPEELIQQLAHRENQTPFNLETGPLLRVRLLRVAEQSHVLLLTTHHVIFDGWSTDVLLRDLTSLYQAHIQGTAPALPALPIQYADYALGQKQWLQGQLLQDHLTYWQQHLAGAPSLSTLPSDRPRPMIQTEVGAHLTALLPKQLHLALKALSQQEGVTLFMTLLAAFQVVFMRSSGQTDFVIGTPVANRSHTEVEDLLGYFVNTLALHTDLSDNPSFRQLLTRVRDMTLQAYAHQDITLEQVVQSLQIERSRSYTPLFQIMFSMQSPAQSAPQAGGLSWDVMEIDSTAPMFDLTFDAQEQADGLRIKVDYNTDLYDASTIERLLTHWQVLLQSILADPTQLIEALPMLADAERHQLLETWNETAVAYPDDTTLCQLFEAQVARRPHATAVSSIDGTLSYQELNAKANQLARMLRKRGVQAETLIGICMDRSTEILVALLGILKAGGAYVPIDPMYPADRIAYMLEDSQVQCLLTQHHHLPLLAATTATIICLDREQDQIVQEATKNVASTVTADNLAYIIYTSGSTGRPKGVQIPHRGLINFELAMRDLFKLTENDIFLAIATLSFDIAGLELLLPLICGARVSIETREVAIDGHQLLQRLREVRPTLLQATPATWRMLLSAGATDFSSLTILCGGEALSTELRDQLLACKPVAFWNVYGPTETTVWSVVSEITSRDAAITIGHPIANMQTYILDTNQQPVPVGVIGELYIGGAGMGRGYLNQPALTQEKFIPHLFHTQTAERLYRTGDLARYLEDGSIDFLGRMDHQVKIRGFRIELGEIETVLQQIAEIKQAVVIDREDTPGDRRLVAYMIANEDPPTFQALRTALKEKLPEYMIPAAFVFLTAFKLTPNGKIDRKALPVPDMSQNTIATDSQTQPSEIMHYQLLNIWEELLNVSPISINDNFFDLGGHSLLAARMIARIEQVFGKKIALSTLFAGPTIEALTRVLTQQTQTHPKTPLIAVQVTGSGSKKPFFFLHGDWSGGAYYCFKLSRKAGLDQPFYVLEPTIFPESAEIPTIEGQAAAHLELVRSVQPQGPYYLGGYCNGSIIAYEMAQQLQAQGEQVNFLAMIDPPFDDHIKKLAQLCTRTLRLKERQLWKTYLYTRHIYIRKIRPLLVRLAKATDEQLLKSIKVSIEKDPAFTRLLPPMNTLRTDYTSIFAWALQYYTRQPYHGKATFIWASEQLAEEPNNPWNEHVQVAEAESHIIAGTHYSILTDEIDALATCLGTALQQAQAQNVDDPIL